MEILFSLTVESSFFLRLQELKKVIKNKKSVIPVKLTFTFRQYFRLIFIVVKMYLLICYGTLPLLFHKKKKDTGSFRYTESAVTKNDEHPYLLISRCHFKYNKKILNQKHSLNCSCFSLLKILTQLTFALKFQFITLTNGY